MKSPAFPSISQALLLLLALFLAEYLVAALLYDLHDVLGLSGNQLGAMVVLLGNAIVLTVLMQAKGLSVRELFHSSRNSFRSTALLLFPPIALLIPLLVLLAGMLSDLLVRVFPLSAWEQQSFDSMSETSVAAIVATCVLAPVLEEMLFRGIILRAFLVRYPKGSAIGFSALIFGVAHMNVYQFVIAFLLGLLAGWLYERSRSLIPCIALHGFYNTTLTVIGINEPAAFSKGAWAVAGTTWGLAIVAALLGGWLLYTLLGGERRVARVDEEEFPESVL